MKKNQSLEKMEIAEFFFHLYKIFSVLISSQFLFVCSFANLINFIDSFQFFGLNNFYDSCDEIKRNRGRVVIDEK